MREFLRSSARAYLFNRIQRLYQFDHRQTSHCRTPSLSDRKDPITVFIYFPFCNAACKYCVFSKTVDQSAADAYLDHLAHEIDLWADLPGLAGREISSIYFGGGTPSLIPVPRIHDLLSRLSERFSLSPAAQITLECNPDSLQAQSFEPLRQAGINRISIGVQSLSDPVLKEMGRSHAASDSVRLIEALASYKNLEFSTDLMYGFDSQTTGIFLDSIRQLLGFGVSHVTLYPLIRGSRRESSRERVLWDGRKRKMYEESEALLVQAGFIRYTTEDFARSPDSRNRAQADCWKVPSKDILALGVAGLGSFGQWHYHKEQSIADYCGSLKANRLPIGRSFSTSGKEDRSFRLFLGLKYLSVSRKAFREAHGADPLEGNRIPLRLLKECGWLDIGEEAITLTREGIHFHAEIWACILARVLRRQEESSDGR